MRRTTIQFRKMMRFPKIAIFNEQNAKIFSQYTYDVFMPITDRQSVLRKSLYMLRYFQDYSKVQTTIEKIQDDSFFPDIAKVVEKIEDQR
ncbi:MAG: hypothetical protein ACJ70O_01325 [Nitrososphaera sp.]